MEKKQSRRQFLEQCAKCGGVCGALLVLNRLGPAQESSSSKSGREQAPVDLAKLCYCGIPESYCTRQCELYKATQANDAQMKKAVYDAWQMKTKWGIDFDADKVFCHLCKPGDKPMNVSVKACPVRNCAVSNGMESCVQCRELESCGKEYWKTWPSAFANAKKLQARYKTQPGAVIRERKAVK